MYESTWSSSSGNYKGPATKTFAREMSFSVWIESQFNENSLVTFLPHCCSVVVVPPTAVPFVAHGTYHLFSRCCCCCCWGCSRSSSWLESSRVDSTPLSIPCRCFLNTFKNKYTRRPMNRRLDGRRQRRGSTWAYNVPLQVLYLWLHYSCCFCARWSCFCCSCCNGIDCLSNWNASGLRKRQHSRRRQKAA